MVLFCFVVVFTNTKFFAQYHTNDDLGEYSHSIGISYNNVYQYSNNWSFFKSNVAFMYNLRTDFKLGNHSSIGASFYPTIGYSFNTNLQTVDFKSRSETVITGLPFCFELPLLIQYNTGNHSNSISRYKNGSFFGAGVCYSYYPGTNIKIDADKNTVISPGTFISVCANVGFKFSINKISYGIRFYYSKPIGITSNEKVNIFGISLLYNFGRHFKFG